MTKQQTRRGVIDALRNGFVGTLLAVHLVAALPVASAENGALILSDYSDKVVVLDFWASWCVPCRRSFPWMNEMQEKYGDDGLVIIAVNLDSQAADAEKFLAKYPAKFVITYDLSRELAREYSVEVMPSSFVIDRDGQVTERHIGFKSGKTDVYEAAIIDALQSNHVSNEE